MSGGCGRFDYGYGGVPDAENTAPKAAARAIPASARPGQEVTLSADGSDDTETPDDLDYSWDLGDGGTTKDATGDVVRHAYDETGTYTATVTVTDPGGLTHTASVEVEVSDNPVDATAPEARIAMSPARPFTTTEVTLDASGSTDDTSGPDAMLYQWNFKNGGSKVDATGPSVTKKFRRPGARKVLLTVTDAAGNRDTELKRFLVRRLTRCSNDAVAKAGSWRMREDADANGGRYCDNRGRGQGRDVLTLDFAGPKVVVVHGDSRRGGTAVVRIDGERVGPLSFRGPDRGIDFGQKLAFAGLGAGEHTIRVVMKRGTGYVEGFVTQG
jgi:hypothetical protein